MKNIVFAFLPLVFLAIFSEVFFSLVYFRMYGPKFFATSLVINRLQNAVLNYKINKGLKSFLSEEVNLPQNWTKELYRDSGKELLTEFKNEYEENFKLLNDEVNRIGSKLIVVYVPSDNYKETWKSDDNRKFFKELSLKYKVAYIDAMEEFLKFPVEQITLLPENGHLSRFGNQILANYLSEFLKDQKNISTFTFDKLPEVMGDLKPSSNDVWYQMETIPFRVYVNKQGFRNTFDILFPKKKQRILILGDSFTFGSYNPNIHTYPEMLNKIFPDKEFINAGIGGYSIPDEASLFLERAKYTEPDIVILQVLDNDIYGLISSKKNQFDRKGKKYSPSDAEIKFMEKARSILNGGSYVSS